MGKTFTGLTKDHIAFINKQKLFFVATSPDDLTRDYVNLSPKGYDTLDVLDDKTVVYADYPGSGNETAAHLKQNGKLTLLFASFGKEPLILRLYGRGRAVAVRSAEGKQLKEKIRVKLNPFIRQFIVLDIEKVKTSCGYGVPHYTYAGERETMGKWVSAAAVSGKIKKYMGFLWKE